MVRFLKGMHLKPLCGVMGAALMAIACTKQTPTPDHEGSESILLIGEVASMTGPEATYGIGAHQGIVLAVEEANSKGGIRNKRLKLVSVDSQGKPDESARAITKLISQDGVSAVVSGVISSNAIAMAPIAQHYKIPFIATIATNPKVTTQGSFIFRTCLMDTFQGKSVAKFAANQLKAKRIAILRDVKSDYSVGLAETFATAFRDAGGEIIMDQTYSAGDIDFRSQLTALRAKNPQAIYVPGYYSDVSLIARQARELGMQIPLLGGDGWDSPKLKEIGGDALSGSYFSSHYSPENPSPRLKLFLETYKKVYGTIPDGLAVMGYEGIQVLVDALKRAKTLDGTGIQEALMMTQSFETVTGKISIDSNRNAERSTVVLKIEKDGSTRFQASLSP